MTSLVLATRNSAKLWEMRRILAPELPRVELLGLDDVAPYPDPVEAESTFEGNALIKARAAVTATGLPAVADDSGICVEALNAMPGVLSARWSGFPRDDRHNNELLLAQLSDVPDERRHAEFRCAVAFVLPDGEEHIEIGVMRGRLRREPRGSGGFGYDPLFVAEGHGVTSAELSEQDKDRISHRGRALHAIAPTVRKLLTTRE